MNRLLLYIISTLLLFGGCISNNKNSDSNNKTEINDTKKDLLWYHEDNNSEIGCNHIHSEEITDTLIRFKRDTVLDFQWIFRQLYAIQHIGRENHPYEDAYIEKLLQYYPLCEGDGRYINCDSVNNFVRDIPTDTIFLQENIYKDNSYRIYFWHRLNSVYTVTMKKDRLWHVVSFNAEENNTSQYINSWRKKELKELGKHEISPNVKYDSNPHSICATRIILTPDSVFMDMFKIYEPYELEK